MLKSFNITYILLGFAFLCVINVFLLNEESLVLLCFVAFVYLFIKNVGDIIKKKLTQRTIKISEDLEKSFEDLEMQLRNAIESYESPKDLASKIKYLKNFCKFNTKALVCKLQENLNSYAMLQLSKKLMIVSKTEKEVDLLLKLLLCLELDKMVELNYFYNIMNISRFNIISQLMNHERIITI